MSFGFRFEELMCCFVRITFHHITYDYYRRGLADSIFGITVVYASLIMYDAQASTKALPLVLLLSCLAHVLLVNNNHFPFSFLAFFAD